MYPPHFPDRIPSHWSTKNNMILTGAKYLDKLYTCVDAVYTTRDDITSHTDDTVSIAHRIL